MSYLLIANRSSNSVSPDNINGARSITFQIFQRGKKVFDFEDGSGDIHAVTNSLIRYSHLLKSKHTVDMVDENGNSVEAIEFEMSQIVSGDVKIRFSCEVTQCRCNLLDLPRVFRMSTIIARFIFGSIPRLCKTTSDCSFLLHQMNGETRLYIQRNDLDNPHKKKLRKYYSENFGVDIFFSDAHSSSEA